MHIPMLNNFFKIDVTIHTNIYDFDQSPIPVGTFDISQCYGAREKTSFAITFPYDNPAISKKIIFSKDK